MQKVENKQENERHIGKKEVEKFTNMEITTLNLTGNCSSGTINKVLPTGCVCKNTNKGKTRVWTLKSDGNMYECI